jgi:hypothetical protein
MAEDMVILTPEREPFGKRGYWRGTRISSNERLPRPTRSKTSPSLKRGGPCGLLNSFSNT